MGRKIKDGIWVVDGFLSPDECADYIQRSERIHYDNAPITTEEGPLLAPNIRNNYRVLQDSPDDAARLWVRLKPHLAATLNGRQAIGLNERLRYYRYDSGQQFHFHADAPYRRENGQSSQLTFMVYLNDDFEGGSTRFVETEIQPRRGMALLFQHELSHEGAVITAGRKYVLRSDVMYNPLGRFSG